jgi:hypothetical protein
VPRPGGAARCALGALLPPTLPAHPLPLPRPRPADHCPWINNCVGSNNFKFFFLFIGWTFFGSAYATALALWRGYTCFRSRACELPSAPSLVCLIVSTVLAIFFAIFVCAMACDQWEGAVTNTTGLESLKRWDEEPRPVLTGLEDLCGESLRGPCWRWFVPVPMHRASKSFYEWRPTDDPDAYDPRDPVIQRHFAALQPLLFDRAQVPNVPLPDASVRALAPQLKREYLDGLDAKKAGGAPSEPSAAAESAVPAAGADEKTSTVRHRRNALKKEVK